MFLWKVECEKRGVSQFWELLELLSNSDGEKLIGLETEDVAAVESPTIPCLYCGKAYKEKGLKNHMNSCQDGPKA